MCHYIRQLGFNKRNFILGLSSLLSLGLVGEAAAAGAPQVSLKALTTLVSTAPSNPSASGGALDLSQLGFSNDQLKGDPAEQKVLNTRTSMLQTHQILGLVTLGLLTGAYFSAPSGHKASVVHQSFAYAGTAAYFTSAAFGLLAPEPKVEKENLGWNITIHKALMFVHLPGMILTPIAGYLANKAYRQDRLPTGIAKYKGALANITYFSFAASALTLTVDF